MALQHSRHITDDAIEPFKELPELVSVRFDNTGVTANGILKLLRTRSLNTLGIDASQLTEDVADRLRNTDSLLALIVLEMNDDQLRQTSQLVQVKSLAIGNLPPGVIRFRPSTWTRLADAMPQLRDLHLDNVGLDDADAAGLSRLPNLETLTLNRLPQLSDSGLASFATLPKLRYLSIKTCDAITPLGLATLRESLPNCEIVWDGVDHRAVAEWVWSVGGQVRIAGRGDEWLFQPKPKPQTPLAETSPTHLSKPSSNLLKRSDKLD